MPRAGAIALVGVVVWAIWCYLVVTAIVPAVRDYITMWPWFMAYVLILTPVVLLALTIVIRANRQAH